LNKKLYNWQTPDFKLCIYIGLGLNFAIRGNRIRWNETKHFELEQFLHAFTSRGFDSVSWAFLFTYRWKLLRDVVVKSLISKQSEIISG